MEEALVGEALVGRAWGGAGGGATCHCFNHIDKELTHTFYCSKACRYCSVPPPPPHTQTHTHTHNPALHLSYCLVSQPHGYYTSAGEKGQ